ncbi:unnamed protein product [Allacma fusca]|uniref:Uncharacterized protein n=1 Tax=Allacma fusca TaxID=39272 RepID=A0A8J2KWK0_9HEXA|nr:unnamed protein product [Allacma fusca]
MLAIFVAVLKYITGIKLNLGRYSRPFPPRSSQVNSLGGLSLFNPMQQSNGFFQLDVTQLLEANDRVSDQLAVSMRRIEKLLVEIHHLDEENQYLVKVNKRLKRYCKKHKDNFQNILHHELDLTKSPSEY